MERGQPGLDSPRFRRRVAAYYTNNVHPLLKDFTKIVHQELGVNVPFGPFDYNWTAYFTSAETHDVFDTITLVAKGLKRFGADKVWCSFVARAFKEENLSYSVDACGGVHFDPDAEFARARMAAIRAIEAARYGAVSREFDESYAALDKAPPDGKRAIDAMFEAVEIAFKLACGDANTPRLGKQEASRHLRPIVDRLHASDPTAQRSANQMVSSLGEWADAANWYRHGQKTEEPTQPPLDHAILMVGAGANYIRWLASLDALNQMLE
jgi:hypothetical protein